MVIGERKTKFIKHHVEHFKNKVIKHRSKILKVIIAMTILLVLVALCMIFFPIQNYKISSSTVVTPNANEPGKSNRGPTIAGVQTETKNDLKLLFVGDIMLARDIGIYITNGRDPFSNVEGKFKEYDLVIGNLETNISTPGIGVQNPNKLYTFNAPLKAIDVLKNAGINVVSLANNHTMDYGADALNDEMNRLNTNGILFFGAGNNVNDAFQPKYIFLKGTKIAIIGFNDIENWATNASDTTPGNANFDDERMQNTINIAKQNADIVVVFPHWGIEYSLTNSDRQAEYARKFIDWGADIIIGSHPHVIENNETYSGKMIYYSMGNFVFDGMNTIPNASDAEMIEVDIKDKSIKASNEIAIHLDESGFPGLMI